MKTKITLYADDGMILTDGQIFGRRIYLAEGADESKFYEITEEEYEKICQETAEDVT